MPCRGRRAGRISRTRRKGYPVVREVPRSKIHDYAGMNRSAANVMGYPMSKGADIEIDKNMTANKKKRTIRHEVKEDRRMSEKHDKYWPGHLAGLKAEKEK